VPKAIDPGVFDCSAAASPPERSSSVPPSCATDVTCKQRLVSAHRGAGGQLGVIAPENTLSAARAAIALGVDFIETDPRPTKDGVLVNVHDTDVARVTNGTGEVKDLTLAELQALTLKTDKFAGDFSCERVATIEALLSLCRGRIHVLYDGNKTDDVQGFVDVVHKTDSLDWVIFDTSSVEKIDQALAIEPKLLTMIRVQTKGELDAQLAHFASHPPVIVEVDEGADLAVLAAAVHAAGNRAFSDSFGLDASVSFSKDISLYLGLYEKGLDVVQTDRPDFVLGALGR
jgi:glycerophosphoryl diester phosphodiesterase